MGAGPRLTDESIDTASASTFSRRAIVLSALSKQAA